MGRPSTRLSDAAVRGNLKPGIHADGAGLYVRVGKNGAKAFVFIFIRKKVRREMGLGAYPQTSLAVARSKAKKAHDLLAQGLDPIDERRKEGPPTLEVLTKRFVEEFQHTVVPRLAQRWSSLVTLHAGAITGLPVDKITTADIVGVLKATQAKAPASAKHLRGILGRIFDYAKVLGFRNDNPAVWQSHLKLVLGKLGAPAKHQPSMPFEECPAYFRTLLNGDVTGKRALRLTMLTAARTNEVIGMRWGEIKGDVWTIPAERTKTRKEHQIPLTAPALAIIALQRAAVGPADPKPDAFVFVGRFGDNAISQHTMLNIMEGTGYTVHGMRASFRQYCADETEFADHLIERCLGHTVGTDASRAYDRGNYIQRRRPIMDAWATYLTKTDNAVDNS